MTSTLRAFKVVLFLCLANDAGNAGAVGIAAAKNRHRPVAPSPAGCPHHPADIDIGNLPRQLRDCIDALLNKRLQLLGGAGGLRQLSAFNHEVSSQKLFKLDHPVGRRLTGNVVIRTPRNTQLTWGGCDHGHFPRVVVLLLQKCRQFLPEIVSGDGLLGHVSIPLLKATV